MLKVKLMLIHNNVISGRQLRQVSYKIWCFQTPTPYPPWRWRWSWTLKQWIL